MKYDYEFIDSKIPSFSDTFIIGKSLLNRNIYCISIGNGKRFAVFAAAFHGLEYLTAAALISFAEKFSRSYAYHDLIRVLFIPMVNPDGVDIALNGIDPSNSYHKNILRHTGIINFTDVWQANAAGTDINHNFDAGWQKILNFPSPTKYGGTYPCSEPETQAVSNILKKCRPELFIAFHSQGKEIYYDYNGMENTRSKKTAEVIADVCGYKTVIPKGTAAFGGAKDWYIKEYNEQAFTVELGLGKNPLPISELPQMEADTEKICLAAINEVFEISI